MKKQTLALTILLALGVTACSSSNDNNSSSTSPTTNAQVAALQAQVAAAQTAVSNAESEATTAKATAESALNAAAKAQAAQTAAETALATAQAELKAAQEALANAGTVSEAEVAQLKADLATAQANLAKATADAQTAATEAATALTNAQNELAATKTALTASQAETASEKTAKEAALATVTTLTTQLQTQEQQLKALQAQLDAIEAAKKQAEIEAKVDSVVNNLTSGYGSDTSSQTYAYLNDATKKTTLAETIANDSSACKGTTGTSCTKNATAGDIIFSQKQSYSSYAVIRENADSATQAVNSYLALVDTATKDKNLVLNATYKGSALFTSKNMNSYTGYTAKTGNITDLTLSVSDQGVVSGDIKYTTGTKPTLVTFNNADIQVGQNGVVFEGSATFDAKNLALTGSKDGDGNYVNPTGTYKGQFAGANGEEVVGTFSTDSTEKAVSVQGAFMGTKQQ